MNKINKFESYPGFLTWVMALLLVALAAGCGGGGDQGRDPILGGPILGLTTPLSITVTPVQASTPVSGTQQYTAIARFTDGSSRDVTADPATAWTPSNANASLSPNGVGGGVATGVTVTPVGVPVVITATFGGRSGSATLIVTNATPVSFQVRPPTASVPVGGAQQFEAIETLNDGSEVNRTAASLWSTSGASAANASLSPNGVGGGLATGVTATPVGVPVVITATFAGSPFSPATANLTVTAPIAGNPGPAGAVVLPATVAPFGLLAFDAITNSAGPSHIYGDVALTQPGGTIASVVGFGLAGGPPLRSPNVTDTFSVPPTPGLITAADNGTPASIAALPQLRTDLNTVFLELLSRAAPATPLVTPADAAAAGVNGGTFAAATDLSGFVLRPGIYTSPVTYGLSNALGPLVLNAEGNADAVFIIRSTAAAVSGFTSTTGSVVLQNGAQAKNIFWVVSANATIGANTFFQGTLLAGNVITLNAFANVEGRMLAGARLLVSGALTLTSTNIITVPQ